ncbi:hypothetical protein GN244_ATG01417 [Phytophthora infestans]|uniref:Secreted RxLR effector peptide protein n=1 Tax=Phytophthora infestans TaxID=4787 RepID=A0A833W829_PHYIN|nr:hypothetical protein GN244_ATG01417 [Phytophthora infestans]KAF4136193.1 hypothetical protein GN958_ATG14633 [Phytophthora infestans]
MRVYFALLAVFASALVIESDGKAITSIQLKKTEKRLLRRYGMGDTDITETTKDEERAGNVSPSFFQRLNNADEIVGALKNQDNLIAQLAKDEETAKAIVLKLSANGRIMENMPLILQINKARTSVSYNQKLTNWLDTKTLDDIQSAMKDSDMNLATRRFTEWYSIGETPDEFSAAIALVKNENKRKGFAALEFHYKMFVQMSDKKAADAAAKKAAEAAAAA